MTDLHYLSARDALRILRSRELSPVELLESRGLVAAGDHDPDQRRPRLTQGAS
jgi:hypothetical protein